MSAMELGYNGFQKAYKPAANVQLPLDAAYVAVVAADEHILVYALCQDTVDMGAPTLSSIVYKDMLRCMNSGHAHFQIWVLQPAMCSLCRCCQWLPETLIWDHKTASMCFR